MQFYVRRYVGGNSCPMSAFSSVIDFCHVERSETSLALSLNIVHGNDLRFFAPLRMTEEDPWKSFAYSGTLGKSLRFVPV